MNRELKDYWRILYELLILSRLEWGFILAGVAYMLSLFYLLPTQSLIVGWLSIYAFSCGHFSINGLFDKESDAINPRQLSLRNPMASSKLLTPRIIYIWVTSLWLSVIPLNLLFIPYSLDTYKIPLAFSFYILSVVCSILYSVPPIRLKSRPFIDIIITLTIAGICFPLYIGLLGPTDIVNVELLIFGISLSVLLVIGIHLPTILTDLEIDIQNGENTTAVYLGWKKSSYLTVGGITIRVVGFALLNVILMNDGLLIKSIIPFTLGGIELLLAVNLLWRKNQSAVELLWKTIIITSITGGIVFGFLYIPS
ncbi:MAG: UbiA family prenyltransferase [Candidatus Hodarchaeales archaeon]